MRRWRTTLLAAVLVSVLGAAAPAGARQQLPDLDTGAQVSALRCDVGIPSDPLAISGSTTGAAQGRAAPVGDRMGEQVVPVLIVAVEMPDGSSYRRGGPPAHQLTRCVFDTAAGSGVAWVFLPRGMPKLFKSTGKTRL